MSTPAFDPQEVLDRLDALESGVTLDQLPLADLRRALIENGEPLDLSVLALAGQVADFGGQQPKIRWGTGVVAFGGASVDGTPTTVNHGLGTVPTGVVVSNAQSGFVQIQLNAHTWTGTQFTVNGHSTSGVPAAGNYTFSWLAIG